MRANSKSKLIAWALWGWGLLFVGNVYAAELFDRPAAKDLEGFIRERPQQSQEPQYAPGEIIVKFSKDTKETIRQMLSSRSIQHQILGEDKLNEAIDFNANLTHSGLYTLKAQGIDLGPLQEKNARYKTRIKPVFKEVHRQLNLPQNYDKDFYRLEAEKLIKKGKIKSALEAENKVKNLSDLSAIYLLKIEGDVLQAVRDYEQLKDKGIIEYAEPNYIAKVQMVPNDPLYPQQWAHAKTHAEDGWDIEKGNSDIVIAIVDTGMDYNHEDLTANIWRDGQGNPGKDFVDIDTANYVQAGYQLVTGEDYTEIDNDPSDYNGHGTHVAGIADAVGNNGIGVTGICHNCKIMPVRAGFSIIYPGYGEVGALEYDDIASAIGYAVDNGANVINMSFGGGHSSIIRDAIDYAYNSNVVMVAAAGNSNESQKSYPAGYDNVIAVAATAMDDTKAYYSNYGSWIDVTAPGGDSSKDTMILSTVPRIGGRLADPSGYKALQGTSMSSPYVAGLAGLILSKNSNLSNVEVGSVIKFGVDDLGESDIDIYYGHGRINVKKALEIDSPCIADISTPSFNAVFVKETNISVSGSAYGKEFFYYELKYASITNPDLWQSITGQVYNPVEYSILGTWYGINLLTEDGTYRIKLSVFDRSGNEFSDLITVDIFNAPKVVKPRIYGWKLNVEDVDGDEKKEILIGGHFLRDLLPDADVIHVLNSNGEYLNPNWPKRLPGAIPTAPVSGDMNNDGRPDILIACQDKNIYGWTSEGENLLLSFPFTGYMDGPPLWGPPVLTLKDVNNDNSLDIIGAYTTKTNTEIGTVVMGVICVWDKSGRLLSGWSRSIPLDPLYENSPAVEDINGDGSCEIVIVANANSSDGGSRLNETRVYIFNHDGSPLDGWEDGKLITGNMTNSSPILTDLDFDGKLEVIIGAREPSSEDAWGSSRFRVYAWKYDGSLLDESRWPVRGAGLITREPVIGDINNDGLPEIIIGAEGYERGGIYVIKADGNPLEGRWPLIPLDVGQIIIGDADGNGTQDIIAAGSDGVYAFDGQGNLINGWPKKTSHWVNSIAISDLDNDGNSELIALSGYRLWIWDLNIRQEHLDWPKERCDARHTGFSNEVIAKFGVPLAPSHLRGIARSLTRIDLYWQDNAINESGFKIERSTDGNDFIQIYDITNRNITSYSDTNLTPNTTYYYRVRAYHSRGDSLYSNVAIAITQDIVPAAPSNLTATIVSPTQLILNWTDNSDNEEGFMIIRRIGMDGRWYQMGRGTPPNITTYTDYSLLANNIYYYYVKAYSGMGRISQPSNITAVPISSKLIIVDGVNGNDTNDGLTLSRAKRTIRAGIAAAQAGYIVEVCAGVYHENWINLKGGIILHGQDPRTTIIDGTGLGGSVFHVEPGWGEYVFNTGQAIISGFTIMGSADRYEGIRISHCNPIIKNCIIKNNYYGIFNYGDASPVIVNNVIVNNTYAGIRSSTFEGRSGGIIKNNIVSDNLIGILAEGGSVPTLSYNDVWRNSNNYIGTSAGTGDISVDPLFVHTANNDYHLNTASGCINAGDTSSAYNDLDGSRNDMGMYGGPGITMEDMSIINIITNPGVTLTVPQNNVVTENIITLSGLVKGSYAQAKATVYDERGNIVTETQLKPEKAGGSKFSQNVKLSYGKNRIVVRVDNSKGTSESSINIVVRETNTPPTIVYLRNYWNLWIVWYGWDKEDRWNITYFYKIDNGGWNKSSRNWTYISSLRLKRGWHTFYVKAKDSKGAESQIKSCRFYVGYRKYPWWRR